MSLTRIVVGSDGSEDAGRALLWAAELAHSVGAEVIVVHASGARAVPYWALESGNVLAFETVEKAFEVWREDQRERVETEWSAPLHEAKVPYRAVVAEGSPAAVIMETADTEEADLIVVGRRGRGGFAELVLGSVGHQLTHHARCPVVVVPPART